MYKEAGPVIETPLSGAQCIHDMLLQSWGGKIRIFPAVPDAWQDVAYSGLRTEGAFKVSASRKQGKTEFVHIKSLAGEPCIVMTDISNPIFTGKRDFIIKSVNNGTYLIDLKREKKSSCILKVHLQILVSHPYHICLKTILERRQNNLLKSTCKGAA